MTEKSRDIIIITIAVILSVTAYAATLTHELVWDDKGIMDYIDSTVEEGGFSALIVSQFATHIEKGYVSGYYRPVVTLSLWFDSILTENLFYSYHLTNIVLHVLNTLLLFFLGRLIFGQYAAAVGSMLFAVHPVHSETVAFVSGRTDLWAGFFILIAVITWIRERKGLSQVPAIDRSVGFIAFFMACLSKEVAFMMPVILLVWERVTPDFNQASQATWWSRNRKWIFGWTLVLACVLALRFLVFGLDLGLAQVRGGLPEPGAGAVGILLVGRMLLMYLRLLVLPWPLKVYYGPSELQVTMAVILGSALFLSLAVYTCRRNAKYLAVQNLVWIALFLVPVLGLEVRGGALLAERFLYIPSMGVCLLAGALAAGLTVNRRVVDVGIGLLMSMMLIGTVVQSAVWKSDLTLFSEHIRVAPTVISGHYNLGNAYSARGMHHDAINVYGDVINSDRDHYQAWFNMGNSLAALGRNDEAVKAYRQALKIKPDLIPGYANLGATLIDIGDYRGSAAVYREGINFAPGQAKLHLGLTLAYLKAGDIQAVKNHLRKLDVDHPGITEFIRRTIPEAGGGD